MIDALAFIIPAVLVGGLAAFVVGAWIRRGPIDTIPVALLRLTNDLYMGWFHRVRWSPEKTPIPLEGPALIVANHRSYLDPLTISASTKRLVHFLMAREYHQMRGMRWMFRLARTIPVNRDGNDLGATKAALRILQKGGVIGIFPEGGIRSSEEEESASGKAGVALLALRTGAPVIPAYISGTPTSDSVLRTLCSRSWPQVRFGEPVRLGSAKSRKPTREEIESAARSILASVYALRPDGEASIDPAPSLMP